MGLFGTLFKKTNTEAEDNYVVTITTEALSVNHPKQVSSSLLWNDLHTVKLITTNKGPFQPDVWLTLIGDKSQCMIPQGSDGFEKVYDIVSKYDGFNFDNFIKSMSHADNAEFLLWKRN